MRVRKLPVEIEALRFDGSWFSGKLILDWMDSKWPMSVSKPRWTDRNGGELIITTLEGEMICRAGNYVLKGVKGEFYPCDSAIFDATYEILPEASE